MREEHRRGVEVVEREVAIGDRVDRVAHLTWRGRELERRSGERARTERALRSGLGSRREARAVAVEHLDPGEEVVAEGDRLRTLEVRVAGHHRLRLGLREREDDERERVDRLARLRAGVEHVQAERGCDLVVARATGVDLAPDVAEQPLDRRVHVLVGVEVPVRILCDLGQAGLDVVELLVRQEARRGETPRVLERRLAVVRQELGVVDAQEAPHVGVESALDPACPRRHPAIMPCSRRAPSRRGARSRATRSG